MDIKKLKHSENAPIREILPIINFHGITFIVNKKDILVGVISGGDLRRAFMQNYDLDTECKEIMNKKFIYANKNDSKSVLENKNKKLGYQSTIPLLDNKGRLIAVYRSNKKNFSNLNFKDKNLFSSPIEKISSVIKKIDLSGQGISFVLKNKKLFGLVTDKDIRKAITDGISLNEPISRIANKKPFTVKEDSSRQEIIDKLNESNIKGNIKIPVIDKFNQVVDVINAQNYKDEIIVLKDNNTKTVLVTGGAGYIGSILVRKLLKRGHRVRVLDSLIYGKESIEELMNNSNFELIEGDLKHIDVAVRSAIGVDAVIHLAGIVGDPACAISPKFTIEQNFLSTVNLANICKYNQINRFIFASSCSVYGHGNKILTEKSKLNPVSLYARDKINSERGIINLANGNFSPTIMRMGTLYGWSYRPRFDLALNLLTALAHKKGKFTIFGGNQWRPMVHVSDAADAYVKVLEAPIKRVNNQVFNIGSNEQNYKIIELGRKVNHIIPSKMKIDEKDVDRRDYKVNFDKIKNVLRFNTKYNIEQGIIEIRNNLKKDFDFTDTKYNNYKFLKDEV